MQLLNQWVNQRIDERPRGISWAKAALTDEPSCLRVLWQSDPEKVTPLSYPSSLTQFQTPSCNHTGLRLKYWWWPRSVLTAAYLLDHHFYLLSYLCNIAMRENRRCPLRVPLFEKWVIKMSSLHIVISCGLANWRMTGNRIWHPKICHLA